MHKITLFILAAVFAVALAEGQYYVPRAYYTIDAEGHESARVPLRRLRRALKPSHYSEGASAVAEATNYGSGSAKAKAQVKNYGPGGWGGNGGWGNNNGWGESGGNGGGWDDGGWGSPGGNYGSSKPLAD